MFHGLFAPVCHKASLRLWWKVLVIQKYLKILLPKLNRHALSTTFRPIGEPNSNPETDPETEGVSSSSRSSRFEEAPYQSTAMTAMMNKEDTLTTGQMRRSASPDAIAMEMASVCRLCLREIRQLPEVCNTVACSSVDCGVIFHQECFTICKSKNDWISWTHCFLKRISPRLTAFTNCI